MVKIETLFKENSPVARKDQLLVVVDFKCGCCLTLTFIDPMAKQTSSTGKLPGKLFFATSTNCKVGHDGIDLTGLKAIAEVVGLNALATEILGFNSIKVSTEIAGAVDEPA